ncbi:MAG: prolyl oligopeptidase family serine peptidase [Planctomycetes bacterium]|nr:prolyl oligopeptidase family serine peptidase [Planctomycetota bacterium]
MTIRKSSFQCSRSFEYSLVVPETIGAARPVLFLHGMGESGLNLLEEHEEQVRTSGRVWILPNGPYSWERRRLGRLGYSWYHFLGDQQVLRASMEEALLYLDQLLEAVASEVALGPKFSVLGFSQGGYLGSLFAASNPERVSGFGCIGGRLKHEFFPKQDEYPPMLQLHGENDFSVSTELAGKGVAAAKLLGVEAEMQTFPEVGHEVSSSMIETFLAWEGELL